MARILVVDDLALNRDYLTTLLRHQGHEVREANDGREAMQMAQQEAFALIVIDVLMPVVD